MIIGDLRFVTDVKTILENLEGSFLSLAECQHELETVGKTPARLAHAYEANTFVDV